MTRVQLRLRMDNQEFKEMQDAAKKLTVGDVTKLAELLHACWQVAQQLFLTMHGEVTIEQHGERGDWEVVSERRIFRPWSDSGFKGRDLVDLKSSIGGLPSREVAAIYGLLFLPAQYESTKTAYDAAMVRVLRATAETSAAQTALLDLWDHLPKKRRLLLSEDTKLLVQGLVTAREADARADALSQDW